MTIDSVIPEEPIERARIAGLEEAARIVDGYDYASYAKEAIESRIAELSATPTTKTE